MRPVPLAKRFLAVVGTRPEAIKMIPVVRELRSRPGVACELVCTGQHDDLIKPVFEALGVAPDRNLEVMVPGQSVADLMARALSGLETEVIRARPEMMLVQGDTASTLCGAMAAFSQRVPVAHIEAGLRTSNPKIPFPEEFNRRAVSLIADLHFAPTTQAQMNLLAEGIAPHRILVTGNTVVDALRSLTGEEGPPATQSYLIVTTHRRENWGAGQAAVCRSVVRLTRMFPDHRAMVLLHPNPVVHETLVSLLSGHERVDLVEPTSYPQFVRLLKHAELVLSDSGGVQEEAAAMNVPLLVLRELTERPEILDSGAAKLVGTDEDAIVAEAATILRDPTVKARMKEAANPFGDGFASQRIADAVTAWPAAG